MKGIQDINEWFFTYHRECLALDTDPCLDWEDIECDMEYNEEEE